MSTLDARGVVAACGRCGRANRLTYPTLDRPARCAQCHTAIAPPAAPLEAGGAELFDTAAAASALPLVVDFWAPWCGPCRMVAPELEKVARAAAGRWLVVKVNTDALPEVGARFGVQSIPTLAVIYRGRELGRVSGARPAADIERFVTETLAGADRRAS